METHTKKQQVKKQPIKTDKKKKEGFFKKYWHIILICILFVFGMMQCTRSCNRNQNIRHQNQEIQKRDSIIDNLNLQIDTLSNSIHYYTALYESEIKHNTNFTSIATGNQNELYNQMNQLNNKIVSLQNEKIVLENSIKRLNKENSMLRDSILYYKEINNTKE